VAMGDDAQCRLASRGVRRPRERVSTERRKARVFPDGELVGIYSLLGKFNNYSQFFRTFQAKQFQRRNRRPRPIFSAPTKARSGWRG